MGNKTTKTIKALLIEPLKEPRVIESEQKLESYQEQVGGYIEALTISDDVVILVNEEGKLRGMIPNRRFNGDVLVGNILIVGRKGEDFCGLSDKNIQLYTEQFKEPEDISKDEATMFMESFFF